MISDQFKIIFLIGLRNVARQKLRAFVSIFLIFISAVFLIFYVGLLKGQYGQMFKSAIDLYPGYMQIHGEGYQDDPSYEKLIYDVEEAAAPIASNPDILDYTVRFETFALFSTGDDSTGGMLVAIEPEKEKKFSKIEESLIEGEYLENDDERAIYVGSTLANKLNVKVGDEISLISSDIYYSIASDNVIVKGIFQTNIGDFDAAMAFLPKPYFDTLFVSENTATHIVIQPKDIEDLDAPVNNLKSALDPLKYEVMPWRGYLTDLVQLLDIDRAFAYVMISVFFVVIFFVIMIFSLISIHTRTKEIGIMRANGTTPAQITAILFMETVVVSLIGIILGGIIGSWLVVQLANNPIVLDDPAMLEVAEQYKEMGLQFEPVLTTAFSLKTVIQNMIIVFVLSIGAVFYPIYRINRLKPIEAIAGGKD